MKAYTNYPSETNPTSSVVEIEVLSYDRNKYATVCHEGEEEDIKTGYIYKDPALTKRFSNIHWMMLPEEPWDRKPTRLEAHEELKATYRRKKTRYTVYTDNKVKYFRNRSDALKYFASTVGYSRLIMQVVGGKRWVHKTLLEREDGHLFTSSRRGFPDVKIHHLKKYKIE